MVSNNNTGQYHYNIQFFGDSINMKYKFILHVYRVTKKLYILVILASIIIRYHI